MDVDEDSSPGQEQQTPVDRAKAVAQRVATARSFAGVSIAHCATALGLSTSQYRYLECQCSTRNQATYLGRLAELFNVSPEWLAHGTGEPPKQAAFPLEANTSAETAQWLGNRAKTRREELSLSRNALGERAGISVVNLITWEGSLPRSRRPIEEAWEKALCVPRGWLRDVSLEAYPPHAFPAFDPSRGMTVSQEIRAICCWFAKPNAYQRTTDYTALNDNEKRMTDIMLWRFGVYGDGRATLQDIADRIGLTRERVRQIEEDFVAHFDGSTIETPALDKLKESLQRGLPEKVETLDRSFRGLLGESLSLIGVERFAREVLGKSVVKIITKPANMQGHSTPMAVPHDAPDDAVLRAVRQIAVAMVRTCGAAQIHFVTGMASETLGRGLMPDEVLGCCKVFSNFEWLIESDGWFWFGAAAENRAKTAALKVLSVATRNVDVEEIHDAMSRARLTRYEPDRPRLYLIDAPLPVLREVLGRIPGIEPLQYNDFRLDALLSPEEVLSSTELAIMRVIQRHGGVASRKTIAEEVTADIDVSLVSVNYALDGSPIFVRLDKALWSIRGNRIDATAVKGAQANVGYSANGGRFAPEFPAPVDGWWKVRVRLPESAFTRRHWIVPVAVESLLQPGEYYVDGFAEPANYVIGANPVLCAFVGKLVEMGIGPKEVILLGIHESDRRLRVDRVEQQLIPSSEKCNSADDAID